MTSSYSNVLKPLGFFEFFCGGGMARIGLGAGWKCLFSNDFDPKKGIAYKSNFAPAEELHVGDVAKITTSQLPTRAPLAWASFPCQDLSLAGYGKGLAGERSGVFWPFWRLLMSLKAEGRHPPVVALENVSGLITSHGGKDLTGLISGLVEAGYKVGTLEIDAAYFLPHSRPRLFIVAVANGVVLPKGLVAKIPNPAWHRRKLQDLVEELPEAVRKNWIWWKIPMPTADVPNLSELIEHDFSDSTWDSLAVTEKLLRMMTPGNLAKVAAARESGVLHVGTIYKRTRTGVQRAEVRFDGLSGCLRTPAGGSSRQIVMVVKGNEVRSRLISARETARLMGLPESYTLPGKYNDAYHLTGDGVVVPVVNWLGQHLLRPLALSAQHLIEEDAGKLTTNSSRPLFHA